MSLIFRAMWRLSSCSAPAAPGVFGAMREGMTGDASILIAKAFLDFFTATIFACTLGIAVAAISVPMLLIQLTLAACAAIIMPLTTPMMLADFSAVGGMLLVATGLRICGIKMFAVVNMLPALVLAMRFPRPGRCFLPENACF
ncbi:inner membrane protein YqgA [Klebsiella pneumoniae]|nr:inner membrane protein YqgA [Klebsiella pneumoniae]